MKKKLLLASVAFMALHTLHAQDGVGIGKSVIPDATTVLDIGSDSKGILIPRVVLTGEGDTTTIKGGTYPESLLVYHKKGGTSTLESGFYFWLNGKWNALVSKTSTTTSEVLTKLTVKEDTTTKEIVLSYIDEHNVNNTIEVSTALQNNDAFKKFVSDLVTSTAGGTIVKAGSGITVKPESNNDPINPVMTYTISVDPVGVTLDGDVTGKGTETIVGRINGVTVAKPSDADFGLALVYDETTKTWKPGKPKIDNTSVTDKADLTVDSSLEFTTGTGTGALLSASGLKVKEGGITDAHLAANAVITNKINAKAVTVDKIAGGQEGQVLVSGADSTTKWVDQTAIVPKVVDVTVDASLELTGGVGAVLATTDLKVKAGGITDVHLAADAVTTVKIKDANVTTEKIAAGGNSTVLTTDAAGNVAWTNQSEIKPTAAALTTDGIIVIGDATSTTVTQADAVLKATTLSVKDNSITVAKLATVAANKNKHLTTDDSGKPQWENKLTFVKATPVATNDVVDGKRVYTVRVTNGTVEEPNAAAPIGYNSIMKAIPVTNLEYLLTAQIYDKTNKLLTSSIVDVTNTKGTSVQFRFGMNNMYTTLPVGTEYIVVLRYVSNEAVTE
ncbi:MAG: hypothetical protein LBI73_02010 [Myroides sp.]|jgi:hypothetical protein|nr:hypothetical protein [Myroides sp.]